MQRLIQQLFILATAICSIVTANNNNDNVLVQSHNIRRREKNAVVAVANNNKKNRQLQSITNVEFVLYNSENDKFVTPITDNSWMSISQFGVKNPNNLNIEVRLEGNIVSISSVTSIKFNLDNGVLERYDGGPAKFMCGNSGTDVYPCPKLTYGKHILEITLYSGPNGSGTDLGTFKLNFELLGSVDDPIDNGSPRSAIAPVPIQPPVAAPVALIIAEPIDLPVNDFQITLINADNDNSIVSITDGMTINLAQYNQKEDTKLSIEAVYNKQSSSNTGYKKFVLNNGQYSKVDGGPRTFMCGNLGTDYLPCPDLKVSTDPYTLEITVYAFGKAIGTTKISFTIIYSTTVTNECAVPKVRLGPNVGSIVFFFKKRLYD
jgi:hypothetical protein